MKTLTLDDLKQKVDQPWLRREYVIGSSVVRRYTEAVGDSNPRWQGENAEVPPAMLATLGFDGAVSALLELSDVVLHGSSNLEVYLPVRVGDIISVTTTISSVRERQLSIGKSVFITLRQDCSNQRDEKVASCRQLAVVRLGEDSG